MYVIQREFLKSDKGGFEILVKKWCILEEHLGLISGSRCKLLMSTNTS